MEKEVFVSDIKKFIKESKSFLEEKLKQKNLIDPLHDLGKSLKDKFYRKLNDSDMDAILMTQNQFFNNLKFYPDSNKVDSDNELQNYFERINLIEEDLKPIIKNEEFVSSITDFISKSRELLEEISKQKNFRDPLNELNQSIRKKYYKKVNDSDMDNILLMQNKFLGNITECPDINRLDGIGQVDYNLKKLDMLEANLESLIIRKRSGE